MIVQAALALGERSIPLRSAYCGAKHGTNGFTSSPRAHGEFDWKALPRTS